MNQVPPIIVIVEDEEAHFELIHRAFISARQFPVEIRHCPTIHDAEEYLPTVSEKRLYAVIVDWNLPDGHGMDLLRKVNIKAPYLLMTSFGNESLAVEAMKAGAMDYIVKSPEEFLRMPATVQRIAREWSNIRQRTIAEEALRKSEGQLRALIDNTNEPIWSIDSAYCLLAFNSAFQAIVQVLTRKNVFLGANVFEYLADDGPYQRFVWQEYYDSVLRSGKQRIVEQQQEIDGRMIDFEIALNPIISFSDEVTGVVVFTRDVSERKRSERALREREERLHVALQEKNRLLEELERQKTITLQAVIEGQEHERSRIAKDLHDGVGQMLSVIKIGISAAEEKIASSSPHEASRLRESILLLDTAVQEVRSVSHQLMPVALKQLGLSSSIHDICSSITASTAIRIDTELSALEQRFDALLELTLYRIIQELINNTLKYGEANRISIQALREEKALLIMYEDDGKGFDMQAQRIGLGLHNIASRVTILGGTVEIHSSPGGGMAATIDIPLL